MLYVVERIRSSDLEEALLVLPFVKVVAMLKCLVVWTEKVRLCNTASTAYFNS